MYWVNWEGAEKKIWEIDFDFIFLNVIIIYKRVVFLCPKIYLEIPEPEPTEISLGDITHLIIIILFVYLFFIGFEIF